MEQWREVVGFPNYEVSLYGDIRRKGYLAPVSRFVVRGGSLAVKLSEGGTQYTRGVAQVVAYAWLPKPKEYDTAVVHKDLDPKNCQAINLLWKPHWWAWSWTNQFTRNPEDQYMYPVYNKRTGVVHDNLYMAAMADVELVKWIHRCVLADTANSPYQRG